MDSFDHNGNRYIVLEYANSGDLATYIAKQEGQLFQPVHVADVFTQVVCGMAFLHEENVIHRDVKPANILVHKPENSDYFEIKITDFGLMRQMDDNKQEASTEVGTKLYMSPECRSGAYSFPTDVWSLGCVIFELRYSIDFV